MIKREKTAHFLEERIRGIEEFEHQNQPHAIEHLAIPDVLLARAGDIEQDPEDHSGSDLVEGLDIERGEARKCGVKGSTEEPLHQLQHLPEYE
jgi:hypothetical protein